MLTIHVFTVYSCVWVRTGVEILTGPSYCCYVVPLSWCESNAMVCLKMVQQTPKYAVTGDKYVYLTYYVPLVVIKEIIVKHSFVFYLFKNVDIFHQMKYLL